MVFSNLSTNHASKHGLQFKAGNNYYQNQAPQNGVVNSNNNNSSKGKYSFSNNKAAYISSGVALAALGVAGVTGAKFLKTQKALKKELSSEIARKFEETSKKIEETSKVMTQKVDDVSATVESKSKFFDGYIGAHESKISQMQTELAHVKPTAVGVSRTVDVNGAKMPLLDVLNPVGGQVEQEMVQTLRSESTKRMLGLSKGLESVPENGMIRIPTSEIKPYSSTGGMAVVPQEIAENLSKMVAGRQKMQIVVDTPLYLGNIEKSEVKGVYSRAFTELKRDAKTGNYQYIKTTYKDGEKPKVDYLSKNLKKIDTIEIPIHTDKGKTMERVNLYMDEREIPLNYAKQQRHFSDDLNREINQTLEAKQRALAEGKIKPEEVKFENENLVIRADKDGNRTAAAKVKTVFYEHPKFQLDAPVDRASNIYNNETISAGETERFVYFSKFFYEHLVNGNKSKVPLKADLILGNDWQTGPISAMARQLTTARKAYGMDIGKAEKIQNTPIVTIMHNAALAGGAWHSQPKLLNVMFGEHAAKIVENSHMPNLNIRGKGGLPGHLQNGLFEGDGINPQMMAVAYSDFIIPVSKGYEKEIAKMDVYGGARTKLFEFRARIGENSSRVDDLKVIANQNGLDPAQVTELKPTLIGITNGSDKSRNLLTAGKARGLEEVFGLKEGAFRPLAEGEDVLAWHNHNKRSYLDVVINDVNTARVSGGKNNPMSIEMPELTDLTGVTEKTPIFVSAGRIVDQKGLDIFGEGIKEFYRGYKGKENPVFYVQGIGDPKYKEQFLEVKREVAKTNPEAAKRIVFANLFSEKGRYDGAKLISDFSVMSSKFEPCGLVHKEIGANSGAIPIVTQTGGLLDGLKSGVNAIASEYNPHADVIHNGKSFGEAIAKAVEIHADDNKFRKMVGSMMEQDFSWAKPNGPIYEYADLFASMKVLSKDVATHTA